MRPTSAKTVASMRTLALAELLSKVDTVEALRLAATLQSKRFMSADTTINKKVISQNHHDRDLQFGLAHDDPHIGSLSTDSRQRD